MGSFLGDISLEIECVVGTCRLTAKELMELQPGAVIALREMQNEPVKVFCKGKLLAHGEIVVINERFGVRITEILAEKQAG